MLRYHRFDEPVPLLRREYEAQSAGRRLHASGILSGALHTLGYFSTDVCLGSPPRSFDLIVDTGSSITAVPCSNCRQCGEHVCGRAGRFDPARSMTAQPVSCPTRPVPSLKCEPCSSTTCGYSVRYTEGSMIRGRVVMDMAHFEQAGSRPAHGLARSTDTALAAATPRNTSLRVYFGCQTFETGMFQRQRADGILGLQASRVRGKVPSMLSTLVGERKVPNAFSLCLADSLGLFLMGGVPPPPRASTLTVPFERGARALFSLRLAEIGSVGNGSKALIRLPGIKQGASLLHPTIVDSGTTFVYASTAVWRGLLGVIRPHLHHPELGSRLCSFLEPHELDALPRLYMAFSEPKGGKLTITPQQYMVEFPRTSGVRRGRHYCAGIFDNGRDGTVIGASILRHRETIFDLDAGSITFIDSDCERATPATANLKHAYFFAPCDRSAVNDSRPPQSVRGHQRRGQGKGAKAASAQPQAPRSTRPAAAAAAAAAAAVVAARAESSGGGGVRPLLSLVHSVRNATMHALHWMGGESASDAS